MSISKKSKATPFTRTEAITIAKRLVKPETYSATDVILFYKLYKAYPNEAFWRVYQGKYLVNSLAHYLTPEGKERLETDIAVFSLDLKPQHTYTLESTKIGEDFQIKKIKRSIADYLR
jgi:hypothetical protein